MHRFSTIRDTATAAVLCTALLWLGLGGCAEDSRPPDWDDIRDGDDRGLGSHREVGRITDCVLP